MADKDDDILSLDTVLKRPKIRIDGAVHEITAPGELSLEQSYRLNELGQKLANLRGTRGMKEAQQRQMRTTLEAICDIILAPVPADVRATLSDANKIAVIEVFTMLLSGEKLKLAGETLVKLAKEAGIGEAGMANPPNGASSSPGSSASTAEAPKAG